MAVSAQPGMPLFACVSLTERGADTEGQPICRSVHGFPRFEWRQSRLFSESATIARYVNLVKVDLVCHLWRDGTAYVEEKCRCSGVAHCAKREIRRRHPCRRVREKDGRRALHSSQKLVDIHQVHHGEEGTILLHGRAREARKDWLAEGVNLWVSERSFGQVSDTCVA